MKELFIKNDVVLIAHYYVDAKIQDLANATGGIVADSLDMAKFAMTHPAKTIIVAGVKFMGETAKILNPEKKVLMLSKDATCSLDLGCNYKDFKKFVNNYPDRVKVVYANTSARVKAESDWVVTSSIALDVVKHLHSLGKKIIWAPDKHLGAYIQKQTGADMKIWQADCIVHNEFVANELIKLKEKHPDAAVLVHPESPMDVINLADVVGSTKKLLHAVTDLPNKEFIVATDRGIFHSMQLSAPYKKLIIAPALNNNASCKACAMCPWMAMNSLDNVEDIILNSLNEIKLDISVIEKAKLALMKMVNFKI